MLLADCVTGEGRKGCNAMSEEMSSRRQMFPCNHLSDNCLSYNFLPFFLFLFSPPVFLLFSIIISATRKNLSLNNS